jgi:hypothetical protein
LAKIAENCDHNIDARCDDDVWEKRSHCLHEGRRSLDESNQVGRPFRMHKFMAEIAVLGSRAGLPQIRFISLSGF